MNVPHLVPATGLSAPPVSRRRRWNADEFGLMRRAGIFRQSEKVELLSGEIQIKIFGDLEREPHRNELIMDPATGRPFEGVLRRIWTSDEVQKMLEAGILHEDDRVELIGGEIVTMPSKGNRHERVRNELIMYWARRLPQDIRFAEETPLRLSPNDEPEPDIMLFPESMPVTDVSGPTVLLVVEVADSSLSDDLGIKAPLYATFGVREYWVIDANTLVTTVHRNPADADYRNKSIAKRTDLLTPLLVPSLALRLTDLGVR